jgi:hypothetical protein
MINPYDDSKNSLIEAKYQCMIENNVIIWSEPDYSKYVDYVKNTYNISSIIQINKSKKEDN